jgi:putative membrane protein insertion efficiency factor
MPWIPRRRYDPRYDPYYQRQSAAPSCLRDACLLETGCCVAEGLDGNCLMLALPLLPRLFALSMTALHSGGRRHGAVLSAIALYQSEISAKREACCRFIPSCSQYTAEAVQQHGSAAGLWLGLRRLLRCRPGGNRGLDPVPA